jgi:CheY-like chemotaxis protein
MKNEPLRILLIEDNPDHAELAIRGLSDNRVCNDIRLATDGESALDFLYQRNEFADAGKNPLPNLILLDLRLPKIDGFEVLRQIKSSNKLRLIPVVILTSSEAEKDLALAYEYHANSYLVKPVDFFKFNQMMKDLDFYWLALNRQPSLE